MPPRRLPVRGHAPVVQRIERRPSKPHVAGSNPAGGTLVLTTAAPTGAGAAHDRTAPAIRRPPVVVARLASSPRIGNVASRPCPRPRACVAPARAPASATGRRSLEPVSRSEWERRRLRAPRAYREAARRAVSFSDRYYDPACPWRARRGPPWTLSKAHRGRGVCGRAGEETAAGNARHLLVTASDARPCRAPANRVVVAPLRR